MKQLLKNEIEKLEKSIGVLKEINRRLDTNSDLGDLATIKQGLVYFHTPSRGHMSVDLDEISGELADWEEQLAHLKSMLEHPETQKLEQVKKMKGLVGEPQTIDNITEMQ